MNKIITWSTLAIMTLSATDIDPNTVWKQLGKLGEINYKIKYNKHGAVIKSDSSSELIYLGKDCDVYSKKRGKGTWRFFDKSAGFYIDFDKGSGLSTNTYGYDIDYKWYLNMPQHGSECKATFPRPIIKKTKCSSDPKLTVEMTFEIAKKQLSTHGWKLDKIDSYECSGTGLGYCNIVARDCNNRILLITTVGGNPPSGISSWSM